jgi:hypothetical protein
MPVGSGGNMPTPTTVLLGSIAQELHLSIEELLKASLNSFLERRLREIKAEIFVITGRYSIASVEEMEAKYKAGELEEADSWRDLQRLDHLEYKRERLLQLLETIA